MHKAYLQLALEQAWSGRGFCSPNPAVGAVIVKNNKILATGYHKKAGSDHAEIDALNKLSSEDAKGATLYVTLEPCCHTGKTPACTTRIITSGIKQAVYAFEDPNPVVAGKGEKQLQAAGINCEKIASSEIDEFYRSYAFWCEHKRPRVTTKLALSCDGKIAAEQGKPVQITGVSLKKFTHQCRKFSDAILTTVKTTITDNPQLNVRLENESFSKPLYILDRELKLSKTAIILNTAEPLTLFYDQRIDNDILDYWKSQKVRCIGVETENNKLDLKGILQIIGDDGVHDLWVEAGATCFLEFMKQQVVEKSFIYVSPKMLGEKAITAFDDQVFNLNAAKRIKWQVAGKDIMCLVNWC